MTEKKIKFSKEGNLGKIVLNDPKRMNSFTLEMIEQLDSILDSVKKTKLKVVIITGSGNSFCAGGDISWEKHAGEVPIDEAKKQIKRIQNTISKIESLPQAVIALINGYAVGGGNELAMACDIRIALPEAKFLHPEASLGTVAPLGGTRRLPRLIGLGKAKYLLFTGKKINSTTALEWGLVDFVVSQGKIDSFLKDITNEISKNPLYAISLTKESVNKGYTQDLIDDFEAEAYAECSRKEENRKRLKAFFKKRSN